MALFRTSIARAANASFRASSRTAGISYQNVLHRWSSAALPTNRSSRSFTTSLVTKAPSDAKPASSKTAKSTKGRTVAKKKKVAPKKKVAVKKKVPGKRKTASKKKPVVKKKRPIKKKVKVRPPKIVKKDWKPPFKKPLNRWSSFVLEIIGRDPSLPFREQLKVASAQWKDMSIEQKAAYDPSDAERVEYSRKLAEWNANLPKSVKFARRRYRRSRSTLKFFANPIAQYVKEQYHITEYPPDTTKSSQKLSYLARQFSQVSEDEKEALKKRAQDANDAKSSSST